MLYTSTNNINKTPSLLSLPKFFLTRNESNFVQLYNSFRVNNAPIGALFSKKPYSNGAITRPFRGQKEPQNGLTVKAKAITDTEQDLRVKAIVSVKSSVAGGLFTTNIINKGLDDIVDVLGKTLALELVSAETEPSKYYKLKERLLTTPSVPVV